MAEMGSGKVIGPDEERLTFEDLAKMIRDWPLKQCFTVVAKDDQIFLAVAPEKQQASSRIQGQAFEDRQAAGFFAPWRPFYMALQAVALRQPGDAAN